MKTLTEFAAITLMNAAKTKKELTAAGKTPEELPAALGEALKLEGDKLTWIQLALDLVGDKTQSLKRVIVMTIAEGEQAPAASKKIEDKYFAVEYYPGKQAPMAPEGEKEGRGGRGGKHGGKPGRGGPGGRRDDKRGGPGRGPGGAPAVGASGHDGRPSSGPPRLPKPVEKA